MPLKSILSFLYSYWMLLSMKLLNISQLPVPRHSSMTKCWARKGEWGNHGRLPNCGHEGKKHALHFPFSLSSPLTSKKRIVPWDGSCFSKMKEQKKNRRLAIRYLWNFHASLDQLPRLSHEREQSPFWSSHYYLCSPLLSWNNSQTIMFTYSLYIFGPSNI